MRFLWLVCCAFLLFSTSQLLADARPNILWITVEDMSPRLGCYGDNTIPTPNIDRLATEGQRFTQAYATYGVCAPSRHSLIMGMYPTSTGAMHMRTWKRTSALAQITDPALLAIPTYEATPPAEARCFSEYLRMQGYYCTNNSKSDYQFSPPITAWDESNKQAHWRNRPDPDQPFFAVMNNTIPHESGVHKVRSPRVADPSKIIVPPYYPDTKTVREDMARHYDNIYAMDQWVGQLLDELAEDSLLDETIIFFFSDHGDGLPRAKRWVYDSGIKVPLIVRWPEGKDANTTSDRLVSFVDFAPTILSLAGISIPAYMEGKAFLGAQSQQAREYIFAFRDRMDPAVETIRAIRDQRYKYIRNYRPELPYIGYLPYRDRAAMMREILHLDSTGQLGPDQWQFTAKSKPLEELYDLENDPHEIHNLAANPLYFPIRERLAGALAAWQARHTDLGFMPETELIKHLWGPDGLQPQTAAPKIQITEDSFEISCQSLGASIAYRINEESRWRLYWGSVPRSGIQQIETKAIRLGWKESSSTFYP